MVGTASAATWTSCSTEPHTCREPYAPPLIMRYGTEYGGYYFFPFTGINEIPCENWYGGDPSYPQNKSCSYFADDSFIRQQGFCSNQWEDCNTGSTTPIWVHYGAGHRWISQIQSGIVECNDGVFNFDPYDGVTKTCQKGKPVFGDKAPDWKRCATQGAVCEINSSSTIVLRFGFGDKWVYRLASIPGSILCDFRSFEEDYIRGQAKVCEYAVLPTAATTTGSWVEIANLHCSEGTTCETSIVVTYGSTHAESYTNTEEWSNTVTNSMEAGIELKGVGVSTSVAASSTYAHSSGYQQSLGTNESTELTNSCSQTQRTGGGSLRLYQFKTNTTNPCLSDGGCDGSTYTLSTVCIANSPSDYKGPQCLPTYCANDLCTSCTY